MVRIVDFAVEKAKEAFRWLDDRLKATTFAGVRITLPGTFVDVLRHLGMATVVCFAVAIVTGLPLLFYYQPSPWSAAHDSIKILSEEVPFGHLMRGLHYHSSNGMILLAIAHAIYVYFKRLYKARFDFIWVTGVILGVVSVVVAFTGYTLIFNDRAVEAQNIMLGITDTVHPLLKSVMSGAGLSDRALRLYALHIGLIPAAMIVLMVIHFPRALKISIPAILGILGLTFIATGLFPAEVGPKFDPATAPEFMPPEWYFLWIFSLLRTWAPVIIVGITVPGVLILVTMAVPWLDRSRTPRITDRPILAVGGMGAIATWIYLTIRGTLGVGPPAQQIPPSEIASFIIVSTAASIAVFLLVKPWLLKRPRGGSRKEASSYLSGTRALVLLFGIVVLQVLLVFSFANAYILGHGDLVATNIGLILVALAMATHVYSSASKKA